MRGSPSKTLTCLIFTAVTAATTFAAETTPADLAAQLSSTNPTDISAALATIQARLANDPTTNIGNVRNLWLPPLLDHKHDLEAATLMAAAILAAPQDTGGVAWYQRQRVAAFQRAAHWNDALAAAKGYFNECPLGLTDEALLLLAECLNGSRGVESGDADRLANESRAGLASTDKAILASPTLRGITLDAPAAATFDPGVRRLHLPLNELPIVSTDLTGLGNLLLLADRPTEALAAFKKLQSLATPDQMRSANEGIARSLRAFDGTVGRANRFAESLAPHP